VTRILVVDDKPENLYYLEVLFRGQGAEVVTASHGAEALAMARQTPPDLVISDLLMPVMDGYTLLRHWKADARLKTIPFVVYTATYTQPEDEKLALRLGADAFILKPCEPDDMLRIVREVQQRAARHTSPEMPSGDPSERYQAYSETLIRKLEEKSLELEETNRALRDDIAARTLAEVALRSSEARFRMVTEAMPQLVWVTDAGGSSTYVNQRWCEYTGMDVQAARGHGWSSAFHLDDRPRLAAAWREANETSGKLDLEARIRRADGEEQWWLIRGLPLRDASGAPTEWFGTCTNIHALKESEARLAQMEDQLRQAQKLEAIGALAGGIAHDFNNLLSVIISYADLVLEDLPASSVAREDIEEIRLAGRRAADLTHQLLAFSRRQMLQPRVMDLGQTVLAMERLLRRLLAEDVQLTLIAAPGGKVFADPTQIEQVVLNLAVNARDAMVLGGKLTIETTNVSLDQDDADRHPGLSPGPHVRLTVSDTGTGMDTATLARMFEPFFTTKEQGKGTGLGLATVFGIVRQSHGHIGVASTLGAGTRFEIHLPATDRHAETPSIAPPSPSQLEGTETILVVEDDAQVRAVTSSVLRRHGYDVIDAQNGGEAFLAAESTKGTIDLLITDVVMPRMSGRELALRLAVSRPTMKVLYVSGYTESAIVHHGVLDPSVEFLAKPLTPDALLRKVREVLDTQAKVESESE
jgi:PAS domain S-box-containing protein